MVYFLLQSSSPLQWQNIVQLSPFALQLHLLVAHGILLLQPHFNSLSSSAGARGLSEGTIVGERAALPSGWYHPFSVGWRAGGSVLRQSRQMATAICPCRAFSMNVVSVGGRVQSISNIYWLLALRTFTPALSCDMRWTSKYSSGKSCWVEMEGLVSF